MNHISYSKNIPVRAAYDCIICGGGCAGFAKSCAERKDDNQPKN